MTVNLSSDVICRTKMMNNEYENVEQIGADLTLMFENAKQYNLPHSPIYKRVLKLQQILQVGFLLKMGLEPRCDAS